jgi:hypothetical protein
MLRVWPLPGRNVTMREAEIVGSSFSVTRSMPKC